jgi:hypothetical protein
LIIDRIAAALPPDVVPPPLESSPLRTGFACRPYDGDSVFQLLDVAQNRLGAEVRLPDAEDAAVSTVARGDAGGQRWNA